jgi:RNA-binding protein YlmH
MNIKKYFVNFIKKFDIRVEKISSNPKFEQLLVSALKANNVDLVLDCGANRGQFADILIKNSYEKKLISFEPLSLAHNELLTRSKKNSNTEMCKYKSLQTTYKKVWKLTAVILTNL